MPLGDKEPLGKRTHRRVCIRSDISSADGIKLKIRTVYDEAESARVKKRQCSPYAITVSQGALQITDDIIILLGTINDIPHASSLYMLN